MHHRAVTPIHRWLLRQPAHEKRHDNAKGGLINPLIGDAYSMIASG
jgi:hypothetical protein